MKKTLLAVVQDILNDVDGDTINSIDDNDEAEQVAAIVRSTYEALISRRNWPHLARGVNLVPSLTTSRPTHMSIAEEISELISIQYDVRKSGETRRRYETMKYVEPDDFLRESNSLNSDLTTVDIIDDASGIEIMITNNKAPTKYTSFDDENLVFNSFDNTVDNTLQSSKVQARAYVIPVWSHEDTFVPDLPAEAFPGFIEEAKSRAAAKLYQDIDEKSEQESGRQARWMARKAWRVAGGVRYPDYGRKGSRRSQSEPTFNKD